MKVALGSNEPLVVGSDEQPNREAHRFPDVPPNTALQKRLPRSH